MIFWHVLICFPLLKPLTWHSAFVEFQWAYVLLHQLHFQNFVPAALINKVRPSNILCNHLTVVLFIQFISFSSEELSTITSGIFLLFLLVQNDWLCVVAFAACIFLCCFQFWNFNFAFNGLAGWFSIHFLYTCIKVYCSLQKVIFWVSKNGQRTYTFSLPG